MTKNRAWKIAGAIFLVALTMAVAAPAQTFTNLVIFDGPNVPEGASPNGALVQGVDGNFYGTTGAGGSNCVSVYGCGTVFKITPSGNLTTLYSFCAQPNCADGGEPYAGLVLGIDGNFYGTTTYGGTGINFDGGTVFRVTPDGNLTSLYSFCAQENCPDGNNPYAGLVQGNDGSFYGTTSGGGANGGGTVFRINQAGKLTTLYSFCAQPNCLDGHLSLSALIQATDGNFYGTTYYGGNDDICGFGCGVAFKITPGGKLVDLYRFCALEFCADGFYPSGLVQGADGNFYGATALGGANGQNEGTLFKITPQGTLTTLYDFCSQPNCADGYAPVTSLIQATDGNYYGAAAGGGTYHVGFIFQVTAAGILTQLDSFNPADGYSPYGPLLQATNGTFLGTTLEGANLECGQNNAGCGSLYSLSMNLGPFAAFVRNPAKVGQTFGILGQGFTGTTSVTLHGMPISFKVLSDTFMEATIPNGATTGYVVGTSPRGTLTSNVPFRVLPQVLGFSPPSGPVGTVVTITGVSLTQANGVGFGDDIGAHFTVNSDTQVTATVPSGAKTGPVGVRTLGGIGISTAIFTVTP